MLVKSNFMLFSLTHETMIFCLKLCSAEGVMLFNYGYAPFCIIRHSIQRRLFQGWSRIPVCTQEAPNEYIS